jgi:hypothetical protein
MKTVLATTLVAGLLAVSPLAFAADNNNGGKDNKDQTTTGSVTRDGTGDMEDAQKCREGTGGGAPCQERGTTMDLQQ